MSQTGQPGAPPPGGMPPAPPPGSPPPPPPSWQSTPQQPAPPPPPMQQQAPAQQMPAWAGQIMDRTPVAGPAGYYYADVPNRIIAYIIDVIIIAIVNVILGVILYAIFGPPTTATLGPGFSVGTSVNFLPILITTIVGLVINAGYFVGTWIYMRGTVGMKALGMQIGNEVDGATLTPQQAIIRWALLGGIFSLAQLLNPFPLIGILLALVALIYEIALLVTTAQSPTKQGLHDRYAHTMVVKAARAVA